MFLYFVLIVATITAVYSLPASTPARDLKFVTRQEWGAKPPKLTEPMKNPVPYVIIHHSYIPGACSTTSECIEAMKSMQRFHQDDRGWNDIGYSFAVGGDGKAYVGRGWSTVGAHAPRYNQRSIGICLIGDWRTELPPKAQLATTLALIEYGTQNGYIQQDYHLLGHRQVRNTECPGQRLYDEITTWDHYCPQPKDCDENVVPT